LLLGVKLRSRHTLSSITPAGGVFVLLKGRYFTLGCASSRENGKEKGKKKGKEGKEGGERLFVWKFLEDSRKIAQKNERSLTTTLTSTSCPSH